MSMSIYPVLSALLLWSPTTVAAEPCKPACDIRGAERDQGVLR